MNKLSYDHQDENPISPWLPSDLSLKNHTGKWALNQPMIDDQRCTKCLRCWIYCPDSAISLKEGIIEVNTLYCKGCGVCEVECPVQAITLVTIE